MNDGLKCLLLSCAVGALVGIFGALLQVARPSDRARSKADGLRLRLTAPWILPLVRKNQNTAPGNDHLLRFLMDLLYPICCALVVLIFFSYAEDGNVRLYMLAPLLLFQWLSLRFLSDAVHIIFSLVTVVLADVSLTLLWPVIRASRFVGARLHNVWKKTVLSLGEKCDMMKKTQTRHGEAKKFLRFRKQIIKELKTWPKPSDVSTSPK